ncbi:hypothetical protein GH5_02962 [Leishmania sp. Ghana 2012 LV757]|uniref:hypothetical protein n=1 Tax=Leishmania sp. Ghana 2012 LV757 TaxID=2803181 RepID=UPI001B5FF420|nr:hypothetical protein GH5_02962 [Leishmania sp. Ghana 2012 LV757]
MLRNGATSLSAPASTPFFSESPVPPPSLDALRKTDVLVRAYYASLARTPPMAPPPADTAAEKACVLPAAIVIAAGELQTTGEVFCAALAREVVEAAANLYASRYLDRLVGAYTACAAWDDMRDVVATSFLQQDYGDGVAMAQPQGSLLVANAATPAPLFLRSALSLAGVSTRTPSCALTPQSCITPPPLDVHHHTPITLTHLSCPRPPVSVPVDAYCRYVMALEEVPVPTGALDLVQSSHRSGIARSRGTKMGTRRSEKGAAEKAVEPSLLAVPTPPISLKRFRRGNRMGKQCFTETSADAASSVAGAETRRGQASAPGMQEPSFDALTTAMRQAPSSFFGDTAEGLPHAERSVVRVMDTGNIATQFCGSETERRQAAKASPRSCGVMLLVEEDQLLSAERARVALPRSYSRKNGVLCRVASPRGGTDAATEEMESAVHARASSKDPAEEPPQHDRGTKRQASTVAAAHAKEVDRAREAWLSSFYTTADTSTVTPLQDQVQVYPSAGVTVMAASDSAPASSPPRRSNKAAVDNSIIVSGGDFVVPADRMALSPFDDKRAPLRKGNGGGPRALNSHRDNARAARPVRAAFSGPKVSEH